MNTIKPITTEADYDAALTEIDTLLASTTPSSSRTNGTVLRAIPYVTPIG